MNSWILKDQLIWLILTIRVISSFLIRLMSLFYPLILPLSTSEHFPCPITLVEEIVLLSLLIFSHVTSTFYYFFNWRGRVKILNITPRIGGMGWGIIPTLLLSPTDSMNFEYCFTSWASVSSFTNNKGRTKWYKIFRHILGKTTMWFYTSLPRWEARSCNMSWRSWPFHICVSHLYTSAFTCTHMFNNMYLLCTCNNVPIFLKYRQKHDINIFSLLFQYFRL